MRDNTPYRERPKGEIEREQDCMRQIFFSATPVKMIWEAFGGLGMTTQVLYERFPQAEIIATELDGECVQIYNERLPGHARCVQANANEWIKTFEPKRPWGASLDFNRLTLLDLWGRKEGKDKINLIVTTVMLQPDWIQITDSAASHLHLNFPKYGLVEPDISRYVTQFAHHAKRLWNLKLVTAASHSRANYMLFIRA